MISDICRKPHLFCLNARLTTSLAAFSTQGTVPALRIASYASCRLGKRCKSGCSKVRFVICVQSTRGKSLANRSGKESAYWIGNRMSGAPNCALIAPSVNCTAECTMDCGCTSTSILSTGTPKSHLASITSKPLFIMVAESIVILAPISQLGCLSASAAVTWRIWSSV